MRAPVKGIQKIHKKLATGKSTTYYYLRGFGRMSPMKGDERLPFRPGTVAFQRSYNAMTGGEIETQHQHLPTDLFNDLIIAYLNSPKFTTLGERTQSDYRKSIEKIRDKWGTLPINALDEKGIRPLFLAWRDEMAKKSLRQADMTLTILGTILNWAMNQGRIGNNYAAKPGGSYKSDRSELIWREEHIDAFIAAAKQEEGSSLPLAILIAIHTGQRESDIVDFQWKHFHDNRLVYRSKKRGHFIDMPLTNTLAKALDEERKRGYAVAPDDHILHSTLKRPWKLDGFMGAWRRVFIAAGLKPTKLHFHDLRGTACTMLSEADCNDEEIGAILGWKREYVAKMRTIYQAANKSASNTAIAKLEKRLSKA